ncbi:peptide/nickel transport system substrate-binding protein [Keratinibaculum paraultunense]|uniref:Peptide/nickel transport system substrate-binding protein n=1 Tax=Keratinibaculum paraultunense TaxID=1278232 RepID=A0A4R3L350_9FIRM|nr:peptide ABC transporter substrate-binding protein [Keratinibaculum paraultunense]TCS91123.1 peptide/nickel transport system substrate-binding protein [Keratinibaculum paraultunense]
MNFNKVILIILALIMLIVTVGCEKDFQDDHMVDLDVDVNVEKEYKPEFGGELILPLTIIKTLNPLINENASYYYFSKLIYEGLFELDDNLNIKNQLAEDYTVKDGGRVISIKLREDVLWHDGEKFTAEDVAFTINTIKYANNDIGYKKMFDNAFGSFINSDIRKIIDVQVIDSYNIDIIFNKKFSHELEILTFPILPKHKFVLEKEDKNAYINALAEEDFVPIGTGPYMFEKYDKHKTIFLKAYEQYREGRPYIDSIVGKMLEDDELSLVAFETGQVHLTTALDIDWEKYDQNNKIRIYEFISPNYEFLGFNFSNSIFRKEGSNKLRKAFAYGIDRQSIIQRVYLGHGTQTDLPIYPNSWLLSEDSNIYGYNPSKAKEELDKLGWKDVDGDGFYEDEQGKKVQLRLITNSYNPLRLKVADMIVENLNDIGIFVVKDYPEKIPENITEEMREEQWEQVKNRILKGDYDIALLGWHLSVIPELSFAFHSTQIKAGTNFIRYNNKMMDEALIETFISANRNDKLRAYEKLQTIINEDLPYVSLFFINEALLVDKKVMGDIDPTFFNIYRNIEKWYIPKEFQQETVDKK